MPRLGLGASLSTSVTPDAGFTDIYSLSFDGTNDYVDIPQEGTNFPSGDSSRTVSCWMKRPSAGNSPEYGYIWQYGHLALKQQFAIAMWKNTKDLYFAGHSNDINTGIDIDDTDWHHIVVTFDGTTLKVYKDAGGSPHSSTAGSGGDWTTLNTVLDDEHGGFSIGNRDTTNNWPFIGNVNDVAIWNATLSAADVTAIYNSGVPNDLTDSDSYDTDRTGNLVGYWKLEEGSGTSTSDSSGEGNTGTLVNGPAWDTDVPS